MDTAGPATALLPPNRGLVFRSCPTGKIRQPTTGEEKIVSNQLTDAELAALMPSELCQHQTPIPTQIVASDEFYPDPQNERQRDLEARLLAMGEDPGGTQG